MRTKPTEEETRQYLHRITALEKHVVLPARIAVIISCLVLLGPTIVTRAGGKELAVFRWSTGAYAAISVAYWIYLFWFAGKTTSPVLTKPIVFASALTDYMFLGVLLTTAMTGPPGQHSPLGTAPEASLFWVYCALVVRNTFLFPAPVLQTLTSSIYVLGYVAALLYNIYRFPDREITDAEEREIIFRVIVLILVTICSSAIYSLMQRRRRQLDEAHERTIRSQRLDMASMLAAQVAHELKNPLSIMTNAAFLLRKSKSGLDPRLGQQVDIIEGEISRADQIISELLDYARLAEGRIEAVIVNDCIDESLDSLKHELEARKIVLHRNYSLDVPFLFIDPGQLRQVFTNILLNACEAIENGGDITISTSYSTEGYIEVSITDTGRGIEPEVISQMFRPFFTTKDKGTGMGLSIVQNVVRAYSGDIAAESEVGKGTTLHLRFPTRMGIGMKEDALRAGTRESTSIGAAASPGG